MNRPTTALIYERDDLPGFLGVLTRMLADHARGRRVRLLVRRRGLVWALGPDHWPTPEPPEAAWLAAQGFADLAEYWELTLDSVEPELLWCESGAEAYLGTAGEPRTPWQPTSLVRYLLEADELGAEVVHLL